MAGSRVNVLRAAARVSSFCLRNCSSTSFRDGVLQDDDEVAVLHGPEELGYPPLTEAMVNIRATLREAARRLSTVAAGAVAEVRRG